MKALTILLAEDNPDHAELMTDTLTDFNPENVVVRVSDGEQLLQYLRKQPPFDTADYPVPDLVLLDLKMPKMDGMSALNIIKKDEKLKSFPLLVVSTSSAEHEILNSFELGANSYITKPLNFEDFSKKIRNLNKYWIQTSETPKLDA